MKLLVEIPNYRYRAIKKIDVIQKPYTINERSAIIAIKNGQPLPKDCEILTEDLCLRASGEQRKAESEELREGSKILKPIIVEWLEEDIDETHT